MPFNCRSATILESTGLRLVSLAQLRRELLPGELLLLVECGRLCEKIDMADCGWRCDIDLEDSPVLSACPSCGARTRPSIVWFGESLPEDALTSAIEWCSEADCLLVVGTSGLVQPAASLVGMAKATGAVVIDVNPDANEHAVRMARLIERRGAFTLRTPEDFPAARVSLRSASSCAACSTSAWARPFRPFSPWAPAPLRRSRTAKS